MFSSKILPRTLLGLGASVGLLLAACGNTTTPTVSSSSTPTTLVIAKSTAAQPEFTWWPPIVSASACDGLTGGGATGANMYMPLLSLDSSGNIQYSHSIASSIAISRNDQTYTIQMNPKWHWSNGTPVTAQDVVFDWQLIHAATSPGSSLPYCFTGTGGVPKDWASVTATGTHTVVVKTTQPVNPVWFEHNGLSQLVPIPKAVWNKYPGNTLKTLHWIVSIANSPTNPVYKVVDGPYDVSAVHPGQDWEYTANPHYDGSTKPTIKHLIYENEASTSATFAGLKTGALDMATLPFSYLKPAEKLRGYHIVANPVFAFAYLAMNFRPNAEGIGGLFNKLYIRQALQYGVDQNGIIKTLYHGYASPTYGPVPRKPHNAFYDYSYQNPYSYDPTKGKQLLESHGWHEKNGVMTRNGQTLSFTVSYASGSATIAHMLEDIQQAWAAEGIRVQLQSESPTSLGGLVSSPSEASKWAIGGWWNWSYLPDYYPSGGALFMPGAGVNYGNYTDPTMEQLIRLTYQGGTSAQIRKRFQSYQRYAAQQLPVLYVPTPDKIYVVANTVHGVAKNFNPILTFTPVNHVTFGQ